MTLLSPMLRTLCSALAPLELEWGVKSARQTQLADGGSWLCFWTTGTTGEGHTLLTAEATSWAHPAYSLEGPLLVCVPLKGSRVPGPTCSPHGSLWGPFLIPGLPSIVVRQPILA